MMYKYIIWVLLCLLVANFAVETGPFDLTVTQFELCKGPKRRNCVDVSAAKINDIWIKYHLFVKENMSIIKGKILGYLNNKEIIRIQIKNMCDHIFLKPVIQTIFNETGHCGVYKGHYAFRLDIQSIAKTLTGGRFMYGNWTFKSALYNDQCNMYCETMEFMIIPKKSAINANEKMHFKFDY